MPATCPRRTRMKPRDHLPDRPPQNCSVIRWKRVQTHFHQSSTAIPENCHHFTEIQPAPQPLRRRRAHTHPQLLQTESPTGSDLGVVSHSGAAHDGSDGSGRGARGDAARFCLSGLTPDRREAGRSLCPHPAAARTQPHVLPPAAHLRIFRAGWLNHVDTRRCQSLWKWGFRIMPFRLGATAAYGLEEEEGGD